jgi:hypothetical protein
MKSVHVRWLFFSIMIGARRRVICATGSRSGKILFFESVEHDHLVPITIGAKHFDEDF